MYWKYLSMEIFEWALEFVEDVDVALCTYVRRGQRLGDSAHEELSMPCLVAVLLAQTLSVDLRQLVLR